ncbi:MAG: hypothetical protein GY777_08950 [Candidatus Brocadiaceae bacterium]|nr:hypothetical protein [Candidatus Brocadiaceae bacterium]
MIKSSKMVGIVLMAISGNNPELEDVLNTIRRTCKNFNIEVRRVDEIQHSYRITDLLLNEIKKADIIIADLSHEKPNVYYEVGYAHGLDRNVILVAKSNQSLHFDLKDYNVIFYESMTDLENRLDQRLTSAKSQLASKQVTLKTHPKEQLPKYVSSDNLEEIRTLFKTRKLIALEESLHLSELANGVYGYTTPWSLTNARLTSKGGTCVAEVHKSLQGNAFILGFVEKEIFQRINKQNSPSAFSEPINTILALFYHEDFPCPIGIPINRILKSKNRQVSVYREIIDITIV